MFNRLRQIVLLLIDIVLVNLAVYVMLLLRFDAQIPEPFLTAFITLIPFFALVTIAFLTGLKLYKRVWEYASIGELLAILQATTYSIAVVVMIIYTFNLPKLPRSVYIGSWVLMNVFIGASRVWWRLFRGLLFYRGLKNFQKVLVVGAGEAGSILIKEIKRNPLLNKKVIGIIDDDPNKQGLMLHSVPILGARKDIERIAQQLEIDEIIIAIPSAQGQIIRELVETCRKTTSRLKILPGIYQSTTGLVRNLRDVSMEDLLRRNPVETDLNEISSYISGRTVMVTGGGGSIGSELCRQLASLSPANLVIVDCSENNLFEIEMELLQDYPEIYICSELIDVRNLSRLEKAFRLHHPQVVFHAAAYKHVPMMEKFAIEAFENNVLGSWVVSQLSKTYGVDIFVYISTDKAVNPTSIMGATKRAAELVVQQMDQESKTRFSSVRFGNVLGSRGSVVPIIMNQIQKRGPVTVTHPDMRRYFMTISEAVQLVIQAGAFCRGGEVFVLDMGDMVRIDDLARDLIRLAGFEPDRDISIEYTGIRPGEKLYEELFTTTEEMATTKHQRIFVSRKETEHKYYRIIERLQSSYANPVNDSLEAVAWLEELLPEFHHSDSKSSFINSGEIKSDFFDKTGKEIIPKTAVN